MADNRVSGFGVVRVRLLGVALVVMILAAGFGSVFAGGVAKAGGTSVPSAPTAVVAVAGPSDASLSWTAPSSLGSSALTGYYVTAHLGSVTQSPVWFAGSATTATMSGLVNGTGYQFTVVATNAVGNGPASGWSNYVVPSTVPSAPSNVTVTAGQGQVTVGWTGAAGNGAGITGYVVTPYIGSTAQTAQTFKSTATSQVIYSLSSLQTYSFTVTAYNPDGSGPASSSSPTVSPTAVPTAPSAVAAVMGDNQASVAWNPPSWTGNLAITGYYVTAHVGSNALAPVWFPGTATTGLMTGLANGTGYQFTVVAANSDGSGAASAWSNLVTPSTIPGAPTNVTATAGQGQATVSWTAPASNGSGIFAYAVTPYIGTVAQPTQTFNNTATSQVIYALSSTQAYSFTVTAFNGDGSGPASGSSSAVSPTAVPTAPSSVNATMGNNQASVTWTAPSSSGNLPITGYYVTTHGTGGPAPVWLPGTATNTVVTGLVNGNGYQFTVVAANADGSGASSAWSNYVTPSTLPSAPSNVVAVAGQGQASLSWTAPANNGSAITGYVVTPYVGGVAQPAQSFNTATSQVIYSLPSTQTFTFTVTATNGNGAGPASAASASVTPTALAAAPGSVVAVAGSGQAALSWTAPATTGNLPLTGYLVTSHAGTVNGTPVWVDPSMTSATITGLTNNTGYQFTVVAVNADGNSASSAWSNYVTPATVPNTPTGVSATASGGDGQAMVWWTVPAATWDPITSYLITPYIGGVAQTAQVVNSTVNAQAVTGLVDGTSYQFTVTAVNTIGNSVASALTNAVTPAADPTTFSDPFSGAAGSSPNAGLTNSVWYQDNCWNSGCGNQSPTQYLASNVYQDGNGDLVLQTGNNPTPGAMCGSQACQYTGAGIQMYNSSGASTWSQEYGTFSATIKMPAGSGIWPAFWLAGSNSNSVGWPACGEIDTLEADGSNTSTVQQHIHYGAGTDNPTGSAWTLPAGESTTGWHTYSITWTPSGIVWEVDGTPTMVILASSVGATNYNSFFSHPFSMILDLTVGGAATSTPNANTPFPAQMLVKNITATQT